MIVERLTLANGSTILERQHLDRYVYAQQYVKDRSVLDVACGTGYGSFRLAEAGASSVLGIDLAEDAVAYAKEKFQHPSLAYSTGDAQNLREVPDESIDIVVSFETIEHVPNDVSFVKEVFRVLRSGGLFFVSTPDFRSGSIRQRVTGKLRNHFHVREYTYSELATTLQNAGFVIDESAGQQHVSRWRLLLAVEMITKGVCYLLLGAKGREYVQCRYYPSDTSVRTVGNPSRIVPNFWVLKCRKS